MGLSARPLRKAWLLAGGVKVRKASRASWLTRLGMLAPRAAILPCVSAVVSAWTSCPCFFRVLGVGVDGVGAPEEPVALAAGALGQAQLRPS